MTEIITEIDGMTVNDYIYCEICKELARLEDIIILLLLKHPFLQELVRDSKARVEKTKDGRKTVCTFPGFTTAEKVSS